MTATEAERQRSVRPITSLHNSGNLRCVSKRAERLCQALRARAAIQTMREKGNDEEAAVGIGSRSITIWDTQLSPDPGTISTPVLHWIPLPRFPLFSGPSTNRTSDIEIATAMPAILKEGERPACRPACLPACPPAPAQWPLQSVIFSVNEIYSDGDEQQQQRPVSASIHPVSGFRAQ